MSARRFASQVALAVAGLLCLGACSGSPPDEPSGLRSGSAQGRNAHVSAAPFRNLGKRAESAL